MSLPGLRLVADIGGTNARFALAGSDGVLRAMRTLPTHAHHSLLEVARHYLAQCDEIPDSGCFAVAGPVRDDHIALTNLPWTFSVEALREALGLQALRVINDFEAVALALPVLQSADQVQIGGTVALPWRPKTVLGPGTGLGVAQLVAFEERYLPIATEGGHASIGAADAAEHELLGELLREGCGNSREALLSGPGMERIHRMLCRLSGENCPGLDAATIVARALDASDTLCRRTLDMFCAFLGTAAGDQALCSGAEGGVYIAGGIVPRFIAFLKASRFRERFERSGPMQDYLRRIPVFAITCPNPGLIGAANAPLQDTENGH